MKYILAAYFVLLLSCVYLAECAKLTLLLQPNSKEQHKINERFRNKVTKIGFDIEIVKVTRSNVAYTIKAAVNHSNVINLMATGLCDVESFIAFRKSKLICISELEEKLILFNQLSNHCTETQNTFSNGTKAEPVNAIQQTWTQIEKLENYCNTEDSDSKYAIVHEDVMRYDRLVQILLNLENNNYKIDDKVLLCIPDINKRDEEKLRVMVESSFSALSIEQRKDCTDDMQIDNNVIALLSHTPLEIQTNVPIIYYAKPKLSYENGLYLNFLKSLKPLKYAFLQFIKHMEWSRVAVLSDDSEKSEEFVQELLPLLRKEQIVYTVQYCNGWTCNFTDALNVLQRAEAKIIILNVEKENAERALEQIKAAKIKHKPHWIVRDWPFPNNMALTSPAYSIILSPEFNYENYGTPFLSAIKRGLSILMVQYKKALGVRETFKMGMKQYTSLTHKVYAYVTKNKKTVGSMVIDGEHVSKIRFNLPNKPLDLVGSCIIRRADYFTPCNDNTILLFMGILISFTLLLYTIILFFNRFKKPQYGRMN